MENIMLAVVKKVCKLSLMICFPGITISQKTNLTKAQMLKGAPHQITKALPEFIGWQDKEHFLLDKTDYTTGSTVRYRINAKTLKQTITQEDLKHAPDTDTYTYLKKGDIFLAEEKGNETQLTFTAEIEKNPTLSPDNKKIAFTRSNNLFVIDLLSKKETQLTFDGSETILNGYASWIYYEEILGRPSNYKSFWWSPDSKKIAFMRMDESMVPLFPIVSEEGAHGNTEITRYPKAGDPNPEVKIGVVGAEGSDIVWADFNPKTDQYFGMPYWKPNADALWIQWMPRTQDTLIIYEMNLVNGTKNSILTETQKTWIDLDDQGARIRFLSNNKQFIYRSDESGWAHLYLHELNGKRITAITSGRYTVADILSIDEKKQWLYFTCKKDNSACYDVYKVKLNGKNLQRLSFGNYTHENIEISPDASYFITTYSNTETPDVIVLMNNKGKILLELGNAKGEQFDQISFAKTKLMRVKSEDDKYDLPVRLILPPNFDRTKKYPLFINIYGGPNAGTVFDGWDLRMQQQWWASEGLIQVSMDHRGSGHFGKEGLNYLHRNLGYWEMRDWTTIVKWLIDSMNIDQNKVCMSGFSYGGYMACYALTYGADYFTHGLAGGSVTDWRLYDTHYTERYMDKPDENPKGYQSSSVMTHAEKYKGLLRIYHGTMDDNVHLQNSLQLVKKLQEKKKHFEFMVYPGGRHGWRNLSGQDAHSTNEITRFIYRYLLEKDVPEEMLK
jgi:dipeptidyl-peptidase-4